jgi:hypothetical protein
VSVAGEEILLTGLTVAVVDEVFLTGLGVRGLLCTGRVTGLRVSGLGSTGRGPRGVVFVFGLLVLLLGFGAETWGFEEEELPKHILRLRFEVWVLDLGVVLSLLFEYVKLNVYNSRDAFEKYFSWR